MRALVALAVFCAALGFDNAQAADAPSPPDCVKAYVTITMVRTRERSLNSQAEKDHRKANFSGLGRYVSGYGSIDFNARADELAKKYPDQFHTLNDPFAVTLGMSPSKIDSIVMEGSSADLNVLLSPNKLYTSQIPLFAQVTACDAAYGFTPALPPTPTRADLAVMLKNNMDKSTNDRLAYLHALSDLQCAVRLGAAAQLLPAGTPAQQGMNQEYMTGVGKMQASAGSQTPERMKELMQREMMELSRLMTNGSKSLDDLLEEVHFCEGKFDIPISDLRVTSTH